MDLKQVIYENLQTITLEELYGYINEIESGYIKANYHPEDNNIVILNYTELATYEKRWNKYTMSARGLILDLTNVKNNGLIYVLAKPFEKFFNYNENSDYEKDINFNRIVSVMEKMDGSLGISYFFNDEIRFATRGSFISDQAIKATEIWTHKYADKFEMSSYIHFPYTLLVEIIYPDNRVVVDYNGLVDLVLIGAVDIFKDDLDEMFSPVEWEYKGLKIYATDVEMPIAKQYKFTIEQMLEMKKSISANEEGWILQFENNKRLKIKGDEYIGVHRIMHGLSEKAKFKVWSENRLEEYIMMLPEEFREELEDFKKRLEDIQNNLYLKLQELFISIKRDYPDKKDFAINVNKVVAKEYIKFMFDAYKNDSISKSMIRDYIFKNYREYAEVVA